MNHIINSNLVSLIGFLCLFLSVCGRATDTGGIERSPESTRQVRDLASEVRTGSIFIDNSQYEIEFIYDYDISGLEMFSDRTKLLDKKTGILEKIPTTGRSFSMDGFGMTLGRDFFVVMDSRLTATYSFKTKEWVYEQK